MSKVIFKIFITCACLSLAIWGSIHFRTQVDISKQQRFSLSAGEQLLLQQLEEPLQIEARIHPDPKIKSNIEQTFRAYTQHLDDITLGFIEKKNEAATNEKDAAANNYILLRYKGSESIITSLERSEINNAIQHLIRGDNTWIVFIEGHGEKNIFDKDNAGYSGLAVQLQKQGLTLQSINLTNIPIIPDNTSLLVIANPKQPLLDNELLLIKNYIALGGNLLWLADNTEQAYADELSAQLNIGFLPGIVMQKSIGNKNQTDITIDKYTHPLTGGILGSSRLMSANAIEYDDANTQPLLLSSRSSWNEVNYQENNNAKDYLGEREGPLALGITQEKVSKDKKQRIAVIGDSDFLNNQHIGFGSNAVLADRLFNWLAKPEQPVVDNSRVMNDTQLDFQQRTLQTISILCLFIIPGFFILIGVYQWWKRRGRHA